MITPYVLRHSYAQRHADAGVPVDVLKELLDHRSIETTLGYYSVTHKRKQQAIRAVGSLAIDASGNPSSFADPLAYERASVSVPFGNCTEPSNVKAGGGACPIRFQCAGCGFYRPDPSYLPALEEHIHSLQADRETARAMGAADYVIANMSTEIDAFTRVVDTMRRRLAELDPEQRAEVEESSRILRRARAARRLPLIATTAKDDRMSTTTANQIRAAALKAARAKDSQRKRQRTLAALQTLETTGAAITFTAVANAAGVSTWLVYADGIREHIDAARSPALIRDRADSSLLTPRGWARKNRTRRRNLQPERHLGKCWSREPSRRSWNRLPSSERDFPICARTRRGRSDGTHRRGIRTFRTGDLLTDAHCGFLRFR